MIVRAARTGDLAGLLEVYKVFRSADPAFDVPAATPVWTRLLAMDGMTVVVAEIDGMVASTCTLAIVPNMTYRGQPYAVIENVATHPAQQRQGLGLAVLAFATARAWEAGCYKVTLATGSVQEGTLLFYERAGFKRNAKTYFEMRRA